MASPSAEPQLSFSAQLTQQRRQDDVVKILLATDNHIGYLERDNVRGQDAMNTFQEILQLAVKYEVDLILLGGDLFHENRPSRDCLYRTIALLREHTLNDKPVQIELLSDPDEGKADGVSFPAINYEDSNLNVGIPVFSIHGNHDDPQGAGPEGALCALDLLSVTGLVNYIGKVDLSPADASDKAGGIQIKPVLLRKGNTQVALYGLGNVKDQRLHFELRSNRVRMFMPKDREDWFNILLIHQNRVKHGPQEYVPEGMFDDSINLVVWGHEHDCRIEPEEVAGKPYFITQPGSSVATSLSDGEAIPKKVAFIEIQGKEFQMTPIPLRSVRPFVMDDIVLADEAEEGMVSLTDKMAINKFLRTKVESLIEKAADEWRERNEQAIEHGDPPLEPMLPLVRLKVDTTGVSEMTNPIRFGQEYQGRVANPRDLLVFQRSKKKAQKAVKPDQPELSIDDPSFSVQDKLQRVRVGTLVKEYLSVQDLQLLGELGMEDAVHMYVDKDDSTAIKNYISTSMEFMLQNVTEKEADEEDIEEMLAKAKEATEQQHKIKADKRAKAKEKAQAKEEAEKKHEVESNSMEEDDLPTNASNGQSNNLSDEESEEPAPRKKATAASKAKPTITKAPARTKAPAKKGKTLFVPSDDEDMEDIEEDEGSEAPKAKPKGRAAVLGSIAKGPAKKTAASASNKAPPKPRATASRTAGKAAKAKMQTIEISDDDED